MRPKLVSIIVVNYNRQALLGQCLRALERQDYPACEVVVVDNGSTDGSVEFLAKRRGRGRVKWVGLERNTGFTGGNIAGLALATGELVALVNNDVVLAPDWVRRQVRALARNPQAGFTASKIVRYDGSGRLDCAGDGLATSGWSFKWGDGQADAGHDEPRWVFGASAAAAMYRRSMLEEVGFLDPAFFFGCEDGDLSFRAQLMGWKCLYVPDAVARHHTSASHGLLRGKAAFYWSRNCELMWLKNMPASLMLRYLHHRLAHEAWALGRNLWRFNFTANLVMGKLAVLPLLPYALRERRRIQGGRKVGVGDLESAMTPLLEHARRRRAGA